MVHPSRSKQRRIALAAPMRLSWAQSIALFLLALGVRLAYQALVVHLDGSFHNGADSETYIWRALSIVEHGRVLRPIDGELRPDFERMPLYPHLVAAVFWLAGGAKLGAVTAVQAVIDSASVFAIGLIAAAFDRRWQVPATLLACLWPSFVVYAAWLLTDSLFIDLFAWGLAASLWSIRRPDRRGWLLSAAGLAFGLALLTRPVLQFFPYLLLPTLAYALWRGGGLGFGRATLWAVVPPAIMLALLTPRLSATYLAYGEPVIETQSGHHALTLAYPCLRIDVACEREATDREIDARYTAALLALSPEQRTNPVLQDRIRRRIAVQLLLDKPIGRFVLGVADAALRSLLQTMLYEVGYQLDRNPRYFSSIAGDGLARRLAAFSRIVLGDPFMLCWAIAQAFALLAVPLQVVGLAAGLHDRHRRPPTVFLVLTAAYFLAVNLSYGNPKYGMPLSPMIIVLTVAGAAMLYDRWRRRLEA
jgi:hypothetical protein